MRKTQAQLFNNYALTNGLSVTYFAMHSNIYQMSAVSLTDLDLRLSKKGIGGKKSTVR